MSSIETTPEHLLADAGQIDSIGQLHILEAMHRRILTIGNEREAATPLVEGGPKPGPLGGQFARLRRTRVITTLFYHTGVDGVPMDGMSSVPLLPTDEYELMSRINDIGFSILQTMSPEDMRQADRTRLLGAL